ncbi:MAG TPA: Mrp/NBP35 family ATP-binding protein [Candidatus Paceibacterota bacterium]|nr:Mrp/NBP35 family ATP-binding protein [Verrucomicrobiota bacterium]HRY51663.1 Mrp/NBP35 family ATP-binding protein [Candidatus Paceibacterota bacterium]HSA00045.1 Mrp/NBP35 family ATP-binding protein [Candidatus Paceibacterota bacterium]
MLTEQKVREALSQVKYPGYSRDIVSFGLVKEIDVAQDTVRVCLNLTSAKPGVAEQLKADCEQVLASLEQNCRVQVQVLQADAPKEGGDPAANPWANQARIPGVEHIVAVASGKGGVGKSTVAVNLACALRQIGAKVGLLDCDIYGPSIPLMMGINQRPVLSQNEKIEPIVNHGVKLMSIGFLLDPDSPVIWRGPMINRTIQQFLHSVDWGELDYLIVDLPPGTGDAQLSLCQMVPLGGGLVVTTPQEAALGVVRKGIAMFEKVNVPVLGLVENMSYFTTPTGERVEIFGHGGGKAEAKRQNLPFLGEIPIYTEIRMGGDQGIPVVIGAPHEPAARVFLGLAEALRKRLA